MEIRLTEKEKELIRLKARQLTRKEIARELVTNMEYVRKMYRDLYHKTGCRNGPGLVVWGFNNGILELNCH